MMWNNQFLTKSSHLHNLREMYISGLDDLKYLFTSSIVNSLLQLQSLKIQNCEFMEVVVVMEENGPNTMKFPSLNTLHLHDLPKLERFSNFIRDSIDMSSLSTLWIKNCPKMKIFSSHSDETDMPTMESTEKDTEEHFQSNAQPFFEEKVIFFSFYLLLFLFSLFLYNIFVFI